MLKRTHSNPTATALLLLFGANLCTIQTGAAQVTTNTLNTSARSGVATVGGSGFDTSATNLSGSTIGTLAVTMPDTTLNRSETLNQPVTGTLGLSGSNAVSNSTIGTNASAGTLSTNGGTLNFNATNLVPVVATLAGTNVYPAILQVGTGTTNVNTLLSYATGTLTINSSGSLTLSGSTTSIGSTVIPTSTALKLAIIRSFPEHMTLGQTLATQQASRFNAMTSMQAQRSVTGRAETASAFTGSDMLLGYTAQPRKGAADKAFSKVDQNAAQPPAANATWRVWASQFGSSETVAPKASISAPASSSHNWGMMTGFEAILSPALVVGVAAGGSAAPYSIASHAAYGQATGGQSSLYSSLTIDRFLVSGALGYGLQHTKASRVISPSSTTTEVLTYKNSTDVFSGSLEAGYRQPLGAYTVMPFANIEPAIVRQHGATETSSAGSSSNFTMTYLSRETVALPGSLGVQIERAFPVTQELSGQAELRSAWVHEFKPDRNSSFIYSFSPANSFTAHNKVPDDNLARISATLSFTRNKDLTLFGRFETDQSSRLRSYTGQAGVKLAW